jgi:hypothetical protein
MPCFFCPTKHLRVLPIESFFKLTFLSIHIISELYTGLHWTSDNMLHIELENVHHVCMLSGFVVASIVEILMFYGLPLPKKSEYMFNLLAFLIEALVMFGHLHGEMNLEYQVHKLWTIVVFGSLIAACIEVIYPDNYWAVFMRIFFFFVQGNISK